MAKLPNTVPLDPLRAERITKAMQAGNYQLAKEIAEQELARGCNHPMLFNARAKWFEAQQRDGEATDEYTRSSWLDPNNVLTLQALGLCQLRLGRFDDALGTFDRAIEVDPRYLPSYNRKGLVLLARGDIAGAQRTYEQAVKAHPDNADALANLASIALQTGDLETAKRTGDKALSIAPGNPTALVAVAMLDLANKAFGAAERRVRPLLDNAGISPNGRATLLGILGDALDGQSKAAEAFAAYSDENAERLRMAAPQFAGRMTLADLCDGMVRYFDDAPAWHTARVTSASTNAAANHIFVVAFPGSDAEIVGKILGAGANGPIVDQQDYLADAGQQYLVSARGLDELAALDDDTLKALRANYWERAGQNKGLAAGRTFVDANPMNAVKLPLISRLFPSARVIWIVRDPRDAALASIRAHAAPSPTSYGMYTLPGTAQTLASVAELLESLPEKLGITLSKLPYESLSETSGAKRVSELVGVDFVDSMETRRQTLFPSPNNRTQWTQYKDQIAPVREILDRCAERLGYSIG